MAKLLQTADDTTHRDQTRQQVGRFVNYCRTLHEDPAAPNLRSVSGYLCAYVEAHAGSAKSLHTIRSQLRTHYRRQNLPWLSDDENAWLTEAIKAWMKADTRAIRQSVPITAVILHKWLKLLPTLFDDKIIPMLRAILLTGYYGLLRAGELTRRKVRADEGYKVNDVRWETGRQVFTFHLHQTKCNQAFAGDFITIRHRTAVQAMDHYMTLAGTHSSPTADLYPTFVTARWVADLIKTLASAAGDDPECFTAHGLRAGGATDLVARGATYAQLKAAGRWKSETCLRYFRSEEVVSRVVTELLGEAWAAAAARPGF